MKIKKNIKTYFITGTGRCCTMFFSKLFSHSRYSTCEHEKIFRHQSMISYYEKDDFSDYKDDINTYLKAVVSKHNASKCSYGISSGHMYFSIPYLHKIYGNSARYVMLVRKPDEFAVSALARGFYDPSHPNYCVPIQPHRGENIFTKWGSISPIEKCLWYWNKVNLILLNNLSRLSPDLYRIVKIENLNVTSIKMLCDFLELSDIPESTIERMLSKKVNASPCQENAYSINPYSIKKFIGPLDEWNEIQREHLRYYTGELSLKIYD